ncbi:hypothetical protein DFH07DRAFT_784678 [Mycena maculata]|uniref:Uncharacterized protein n=1 Tax=Mycena maculata TaxID=230809 RepID=A0AAD7HFM7_9AGAR|nr:hypothetical protein DFH07DRAFT_784678 [Mycena maculata]
MAPVLLKSLCTISYLPAASTDQMAQIGRLYPDNPTRGSSFDTGTVNQITPEFKRLAAFQGDYVFTGGRKGSSLNMRQRHKIRGVGVRLVSKLGKNTTDFGASHTSDTPGWLPASGSDTTGVDALGATNRVRITVNFINTLDPNRAAGPSTSNSSIICIRKNSPFLIWGQFGSSFPNWPNLGNEAKLAGFPSLVHRNVVAIFIFGQEEHNPCQMICG